MERPQTWHGSPKTEFKSLCFNNDDAISLMFAFANGNFSEEKIEAGEWRLGLNALLAAKEDKKSVLG